MESCYAMDKGLILMKQIIILFLLLLAPQAQSEAELNFKDKGMIVKLSTMKAIVPPTNVTVLEPHEQKLMQFSAISVNFSNY